MLTIDASLYGPSAARKAETPLRVGSEPFTTVIPASIDRESIKGYITICTRLLCAGAFYDR